MPRETGRLYCTVVRESGSGQYTVVGVNEIDMNLHRTGVVWVSCFISTALTGKLFLILSFVNVNIKLDSL